MQKTLKVALGLGCLPQSGVSHVGQCSVLFTKQAMLYGKFNAKPITNWWICNIEEVIICTINVNLIYSGLIMSYIFEYLKFTYADECKVIYSVAIQVFS
jgi:hypothetical protein